jgi:mono/diheme cytochrome c family protein
MFVLHARVLAIAAGLVLHGAAAAADQNLIAKGKYLIHAGGCITCHTEESADAVPLSGGYALESPFGTFYAPNITPDAETGIGNWSDEDFLRAFHEGTNPEGDAYFPAFPYTAYTGIRRDEVLAMKAYLFSLDPVRKQIREHDLPAFMSSRLAARAWQLSYFEAARFEPDTTKSSAWNRGAYLVRHLGHCGECHTPRGALGALLHEKELTGNPDSADGESVPNITADKASGIGRWALRDIEYFLDLGMLPDGDFTGGAMSDVIEDNTSHLTSDDRLAIATYLLSLTPAND